jgi:hypothetical protein
MLQIVRPVTPWEGHCVFDSVWRPDIGFAVALSFSALSPAGLFRYKLTYGGRDSFMPV